jgi:hypothetical protein
MGAITAIAGTSHDQTAFEEISFQRLFGAALLARNDKTDCFEKRRLACKFAANLYSERDL